MSTNRIEPDSDQTDDPNESSAQNTDGTQNEGQNITSNSTDLSVNNQISNITQSDQNNLNIVVPQETIVLQETAGHEVPPMEMSAFNRSMIRSQTDNESRVNLLLLNDEADDKDDEKDKALAQEADRILENLGASDDTRVNARTIIAPRFMYKISLKKSQELVSPTIPSTSMGMNTKVSSSSRGSSKSVDKSTNTSMTEKSSVISVVCRICYDETLDEPVISPCNCKGTIGLVHKSCLERWLAESNTDKCDLCNKQFQTERKTKYTVGTSLCVWLRYRSSQFAFPIRDLKGDIISCSVLSPVALGLIYICLLSADYYNQTEFALVPAAQWTSMSVMLMGLIMLLGFFVWIYLVIRYHSRVWYFWWQRETIVQVYLGESEMVPKHKIPKAHVDKNAQTNTNREMQTIDIGSHTGSM